MPRRYHYVMRFRCPQCKRAGSAKWEESEQAAGGGRTSILKTVSQGFRAHAHNLIVCASCNARVVYGHG
jgi:hypothetical protein